MSVDVSIRVDNGYNENLDGTKKTLKFGIFATRIGRGVNGKLFCDEGGSGCSDPLTGVLKSVDENAFGVFGISGSNGEKFYRSGFDGLADIRDANGIVTFS